MKRFVCTLVLAAIGTTLAADSAQVSYPKGYRAWQHVKSMVIHPGHALYESFGGIHHLYANSKAMEGYRSGRFPDGSVLIFDLFEAVTADAMTTEGKHKVLGVMHKDGAKFAATGGWGFEGFASGDASKRVVGDKAATACFACHQAQKAHDYVFSSYRD